MLDGILVGRTVLSVIYRDDIIVMTVACCRFVAQVVLCVEIVQPQVDKWL